LLALAAMLIDTGLVDPRLREALDRISQSRGAAVGRQISQADSLREQFGHSIAICQAVEDAVPSDGQFNCFMHALEMSVPPPLVLKILKRFDTVYPGAEFVAVLVQQRLLVELAELEDDAILIYFRDSWPKHAGKAKGRMVISKWGLGHLWRHRLFELPASYGPEVRVFQRVDEATAANWFIQYAKSRLGEETIARLSDT
jgi:hypothetical protein